MDEPYTATTARHLLLMLTTSLVTHCYVVDSDSYSFYILYRAVQKYLMCRKNSLKNVIVFINVTKVKKNRCETNIRWETNKNQHQFF